MQLLREYLYFCTNKASTFCTSKAGILWHAAVAEGVIRNAAYVSICQHVSAYVSKREDT